LIKKCIQLIPDASDAATFCHSLKWSRTNGRTSGTSAMDSKNGIS
jgi:hypothetical protein